jgi:dihydrolipoamide dehydrogenase
MDRASAEVIVVGAGPGGYAAAFYAADRGKKVVLVERDPRLGGVCLIRGCIPSKALIHATNLISEAEKSAARGIDFGRPSIHTGKLRTWKDSIVDRLSQGIRTLAGGRGIEVIEGRGHFESSGTLRVETSEGQRFVDFENAIIAVGSKPAIPKAWDLGNPRVMTSTEALEIESIPERLLVIGAGYIGMELGMVYAALGSQVVVVEALAAILSGADPDLTRPVLRRAKEQFAELRLDTRISRLATKGKQIEVTTTHDGEERVELYDRVLVAVGRRPVTEDIGLENTGVELDDGGFIRVDDRQRTADPNIYAIGDVVGGVLLAHKASREGRVAVESILGETSAFESVMPAVVFTDPEVAWCGLTEEEAKRRGIEVQIARFPWGASGRAVALDRPDGLTKLVVEPESERILGMGVVGAGAGELIGEGVILIEMGATVRDLAESVHPHPTLSETLMECAEMFYGHATHAAARKTSK